MRADTDTIDEFVASDYKYGFVTDIESESIKPGLGEETVRFISAKKNEPEWLLEWRLKALRCWEKLECPTWPHVDYPPVDFQDISYYSAPKKKGDGPKSLDEVDPKLLETYEKLGVPLHERAGWPVSQWTRCLTANRSARRSKRIWPRPVLFSARSPRRCRNIPNW